MPIRIPDHLPAAQVLTDENIFVMPMSRAMQQDIRPIRLLILNLMPNKIETETQLLRLLSNNPLQIDVELLRIHDKASKHTAVDHMQLFYRDFDEIKSQNYDGLIITGAPLGAFAYEAVHFWQKFTQIVDWAQTHVNSTLYLCWAAHAALYHCYGIKRKILEQKRFGVFAHVRRPSHQPLLRGFDDTFEVPHSRIAEIPLSALENHPKLEILADSSEAGAYLLLSKDNRQLFVTGHPEYLATTLKDEYERDLAVCDKVKLPKNYFPHDDVQQAPLARWRGHGHLLFSNWLNYYVYQLTPYNLKDMRANSR